MCSSKGSLVTTSIMDDHGVWINVENVIWATAVKLFCREKDPNYEEKETSISIIIINEQIQRREGKGREAPFKWVSLKTI